MEKLRAANITRWQYQDTRNREGFQDYRSPRENLKAAVPVGTTQRLGSHCSFLKVFNAMRGYRSTL